MLCLSAFELYSHWVPLFCVINMKKNGLQIMSLAAYATKTNQHKYFQRNYTLFKKNMQKIGVVFSGTIYVSHHLLFNTVIFNAKPN